MSGTWRDHESDAAPESTADESEALKAHWTLAPSVVFLNHGSFGACPRSVLAAQQAVRDRMESQPVRFFVRDLEALLDRAREALAHFIDADPLDLVFVPNATTAVTTVLRSVKLQPGDELLTTDHTYAACRYALDDVAARTGAHVVVAPVPLPIRSEQDVIEAVLGEVTRKTKLALLDHVTSPTALIWPIERLVAELQAKGVDVLVDGAHAPAMVPLSMRAIGSAYYAGNCHKWLCAPKGAGFLYVRRDRQQAVHALVVSHGARAKRDDRSRFWLEFDWQGTGDPSAYLAVPAAIDFVSTLMPGGLVALQQRNRAMALRARSLLQQALRATSLAPETMIGSMASVLLPDEPPAAAGSKSLQDRLLEEYGIEVPIVSWPAPPQRLVRISSQAYNRMRDYEQLADALRSLLQQA